MLLSPRHLVDRLRHPRSRADELARLRARFSAQPSVRSATPLQLQLVARLRELRAELSAALRNPSSCSGCAQGSSLPHGRYDGGHCCGTSTFEVFNSAEVVALKWSGTDASRLPAPAGDHAGCAFRGPTGCSLTPADRPTICVTFLCTKLRDELTQSSDWNTLRALRAELRDTFEQFAKTLPGQPD